MCYKFFIFMFPFFVALAGAAPSFAAVIKKADTVAVQKQETGAAGLMSGNSLIPTALGLVGNVMALTQQQNALTKECEPTDAEISAVKGLMQEWARAGGSPPTFGSDRGPCVYGTGVDYAASVGISVEGIQPCYNNFNGSSSDVFQVYAGYPYPGKGWKLKDPSAGKNEKNKIILSDLYEMFAAIGFSDADYLPSEVSVVTPMKEKALKCAPAVLKAKQKELWGGMLVQTVGGLGQKQNTGDTMSQVGQIMQSGGGSPLGSLMGIAPVLMGSLTGGN
jgi:hypothetical protein